VFRVGFFIVGRVSLEYNGESREQIMDGAKEPTEYRFRGFCLDMMRRRLMNRGEQVALTAKAFDTLVFLVRHHGQTVSKSELMNAIWADSAVEENNLTQQIAALRRAFSERPNDHRFIVTVPGRGYCFVAELENVRITPKKRPHFDPAVVRGYSLAAAQVLLLAFAFLWSAIEHSGDRPHSLAVLNFKTTATGDEFIGSGISETLRARLGSVEDLIVRPIADHDALVAGKHPNVDTVVTGSVLRDGDQIRVVVEMVDVSDGRIVWGKTFDATSASVFALQDAIAGEVARALNVSISYNLRKATFLT
jgi:DNA-binding winged helix-turn-helix (wHTH) protein/TolB-like protein